MSSHLYIKPSAVTLATDWAVTGTGDKLVAVTDDSDSTYLQNTSTGELKLQHPATANLARPGVSIEEVYVRYRNASDEPSTIKFYLGAVTSQVNPTAYAGAAAWFEEDFSALHPGGGSWVGSDFNGTWYTSYSKSTGISCRIYEAQVHVVALFPSDSLCQLIIANGLGPLLALGALGAQAARWLCAARGALHDLADIRMAQRWAMARQRQAWAAG